MTPKRLKIISSICLASSINLLSGCASSEGDERASLMSKDKSTTSIYTLKSGGHLPERQKGLSITKADLSFTILPDHQAIIGDATLTFNTVKPINELSVDLDRIFTINSIEVDGVRLSESQYENDIGELILRLNTEKTGQFTVQIKYDGKPRTAIRAPWDGGFDWKRTESGQHWIATAVQGEGCDLFWPCIDQPFGEIPEMDIHITVPSNLVAASNGVLVNTKQNGDSTTYHWQTKNLHNTYAIALNIGPYDVIEDTYQSFYGNKVPVQFFHLKENADKAQILFSEIKPMVEFFERVIGPYPFSSEKIGVAETPHLGMEHQTINAYGNQYRKDELGYDWLLHHEFAHEWFGNQVTNNDWDHMWLHEGFGSYMQPLYTQYLHGDMAYKSHLQKQRLGLINKYPLVQNKSVAVEEVYDSETGPGNDIYAKGSLILHTLRTLIGDDAFFASIRQLVYGTATPKPGNFKPRFSDTAEFIAIVNQQTGKNLQWFFDVYVYQAALPELVMERTDSSMKLEWKIENQKPFPMPLEISINGEVKTYDMSSPIEMDVHPTDIVIVDPQSKILKHRQHINDYQQYLKQQREKWMQQQPSN